VTDLGSNTSLHHLVDRYPFLVEFLAGYNSKFELLRNPLMRATVGRAATLGRVAEMGGISVEELLRDIAAEVRERTGANLPGEDDAAGPHGAAESEGRGRGGNGPDGAARMKDLILDLHDGLSLDAAKERFDDLIRDVSPEQIGAMEEQLIREGMPVQEIQRLCDLHVAVMRGGLDRQEEVSAPPGHPVHTYMAANEVITRLANRVGDLASRLQEEGPSTGTTSGPASSGASSSTGGLPGGDPSGPTDPALRAEMARALEDLSGIHNHYLRKENQLFPFLERHGITGPAQVMWGVHDEIRGQLKEARAAVEGGSAGDLSGKAAALARSVVEMVYKENKILFPLSLQNLTGQEWSEVRRGEDELGYAFAKPAGQFDAAASPRPGGGISLPIVAPARRDAEPRPRVDGFLDLGTGKLSLEQVDMILRHLPVDLSFVDADGFVLYYSETPERLFPRTPGAIGRHVENCHPPKSVHMVKEILRAFAGGERDVAEFWIEMGGKFIHIRYFAVRNPDRKYLGCLEVSQDVTAIRALEGQRRLLEWS